MNREALEEDVRSIEKTFKFMKNKNSFEDLGYIFRDIECMQTVVHALYVYGCITRKEEFHYVDRLSKLSEKVKHEREKDNL